VAAVVGVTMCPTVGSAAVVGAFDILGLHGCNQGVGRGLNACHGQCVFRREWNGCGWRKRRSGDNGCGVAGVISCLAGSRE